MTDRTLVETETAIYQNAANRGEWHLGTEDPVMIRKMERLGIKPTKATPEGWHEYTLQGNQVSFRKGAKREYSDEERAAAGTRLALSRQGVKDEGIQ